MPVSSASSPELAAGSTATTILARFGAAAWRAASMIPWAPQCTRGVLEQFGVELLPAEARAFVFADHLVEEPGRQIGAIFVRRAPRDRNITAFAGEQFADQPGRPRRRRNQQRGLPLNRNPNCSMSQVS